MIKSAIGWILLTLGMLTGFFGLTTGIGLLIAEIHWSGGFTDLAAVWLTFTAIVLVLATIMFIIGWRLLRPFRKTITSQTPDEPAEEP